MTDTPATGTPADDPTLSAVVRALAARKAERLVVLDLRDKVVFTEYFVICHGTSDRQVRSLAEDVVATVRDEIGRKPRIEGLGTSEWVCLDYGDVLVHVFSAEARDFYRLESLWGDAVRIDATSIAP